MKKAEKATSRRRRNPVPVVLHLLLAFALVLSLVSVPMAGTLDVHLSHLKTSSSLKEDRAATVAINAQVEAEGAVLLENHEQTLPLAAESRVCVFGRAAVSAVRGDGRTGGKELSDGLSEAGFEVSQVLMDFYNKQKNAEGEVPAAEYDAQALSNARNDADIALVVLSHTAQEGAVLTEAELSLLQLVADLDFSKTVVLVNSPVMLQLDFLKNEAYGIDAAMWIGAPGEGGFAAVGQLLCGAVNPSGRTVSTCAMDAASVYGAQEGENPGIYAGYRYFETRFSDETAYTAAVQYPMGYGLSYTQFEKRITRFACNGAQVMLTVQVSNTGEVSGADVVQVYAAPAAGKLEKPAKVLMAWVRTDVLAPGASAQVELSFPVEDMASFDAQKGCYTVEKGVYNILLAENAHKTLEKRALHMEQDFDYETCAANLSAMGGESALSRDGWSEKAVAKRESGAEQASAEMDNQTQRKGGRSKVKLPQLKGKDYEDEGWSEVLAALSDQQLSELSAFESGAVSEMRNIGLTDARFLGGAYGLTQRAHGVRYEGTVLPGLSLRGSTWDADLMEQMGAAEGREAYDMGLVGIMDDSAVEDGYSEDGTLSGGLMSRYVSGVQSAGPMWVLFADANANEQALREVHLRPAEMSVEQGLRAVRTQQAGELEALLRVEWGFDGALLNGSNPANEDAAHRLLYAIVQSDTDGEAGPKSNWRKVLVAVDLILLLLNGGIVALQLSERKQRTQRRNAKV